MKINQMKAFQEIMLTGSVSEAARNLHRSQPAVSALIAGLEEELEMKLFERRKGRLHPVPEAHYLLEECSEVLGRVDTLKQNIRGMRGLLSGRLEITSMPGPSIFLLPELISDFTKNRPEVECALISRSSDVVFKLISAQQYDLGLADYFEGKVEETSLVKSEVFQFDCLCAMPSDDPMAENELITPRMLDNKPLATLYAGHEITQNLERTFRQNDCKMNVRFTTHYFMPLLTYVANGLAYALIDPITVASYRLFNGDDGPLIFKPMKPSVSYRISILSPTYRPPTLLTQAFAQNLKEEMIKLGGVFVEPSDYGS